MPSSFLELPSSSDVKLCTGRPRTAKRPLRALGLMLLAALLAVAVGGPARADEPVRSARVDDAQHGLAVVGMGASVDLAWPLARAVYADASLRPTTLDEAHARVLVGEPAGEGATAELRDLADLRAAIHGDDAASRQLLQSIGLSLHVKGVVVVQPGVSPGARPAARVFVTTSNAYDAVLYEADPSAPVTWGTGTGPATWGGAVQALRRGFAEAPAVSVSAPVAAAPVAGGASPGAVRGLASVGAGSRATDKGAGSQVAFYQSPWFWAAAGAALFAAGAVYFATRNDGSDNIQLQVQVPK